jgi:lactobin A/cerein 7B family class IIb bacteriocin
MSNEELMNIKGGIGRTYFYGIIVGAITFIIGLVDGIIRPLRCNE